MQTIKSKQDFAMVFKNGKRLFHPAVRIIYIPSTQTTRVAYCAPKKIGCAPLRNRCKRLLRAAVRDVDCVPQHFDVILFATYKTKAYSSCELSKIVNKLLHSITTT